MNNNTPVSPRPLSHLSADARRRVFSMTQLRRHGISAGQAAAHCRPGGSWQQLLPGVYLLHSGPPSGEERLHATLRFAEKPGAEQARAVPVQGGPPVPSYSAVMITGPAALTLHGFSATPPLLSLDTIDVLVPRTRRLKSAGYARLIRTHALPRPQQIGGVPVAPVARALADAVTGLSDPETVSLLLTEAVRDGHCEPAALVRELRQAQLLARPHVVNAVDALLAEGRSLSEQRLYDMVRAFGLPDPAWNVELRLPGESRPLGVDAYWPDQAVAVGLDTRAPRPGAAARDNVPSEYAAERERLERSGITVILLTPAKLRESPEQQATVVRTALMAADDQDPAAYVTVLPR